MENAIPLGIAELVPLGDELAGLIEDLQPGIAAIGDKDPASLVHADAVRGPELTRSVASRAPLRDELPLFRVLDDAVVGTVAVGDEHLTGGIGHDTRRRSEMDLVVAGDSRFAQRHQHLAIRAELADDVPGFDAGFRRGGDRRFRRRVGHPDVGLSIDVHAVRPDEHPAAKAALGSAIFVEPVDRIERLELAVGIHAVETEPAAGAVRRGRNRTGLVASNQRPDAFAVNVDVQAVTA